MEWHWFFVLGMMPFGLPTDPALPQFMERVSKEIPNIVTHGPYRDYEIGNADIEASKLPTNAGLLYTGVSLGACNATTWAARLRRHVDALLCFQASNYGYNAPVSANVRFAYLFNSDNPLPFPGLGAHRWERGEGMTGGLINHTHNIPHPGDYDFNDQTTFIEIAKRIMAHGATG